MDENRIDTNKKASDAVGPEVSDTTSVKKGQILQDADNNLLESLGYKPASRLLPR
jgi:hypothetical protein